MVYVSQILVLFLLCLASGAEKDYIEKLLTESKLKGNFFLFDDNNNVKELKWVFIYSLKDESKIMGINQKVLLKESNKEIKKFTPSENYIILKPEEFKKIFLFLALKYESKLEIFDHNYKIFAYRSLSPYFISIYRYSNDTWRGIKMDWSETNKLMRNASQIMHDLGI